MLDASDMLHVFFADAAPHSVPPGSAPRFSNWVARLMTRICTITWVRNSG
jgi:hypothetical protein